MKRNRSITGLNIFSSILLQIVTIISGFIIPRIILGSFGSEANGLVSSLNQFLNYVALFEGGLSAVVLANLYKPLANRDMQKVSMVVATTRKFYNKLAIGFLIYVVFLAFLYPVFVESTFSYEYVVSMTMILAINTFVRYAFSISLRLLLQADKKVYIISFTQVAIIILNVILFVGLRDVFPDLRLLEFVSALVFLLQPISYYIAVRKHLAIEKNIKEDKSLIKSRWDGLGVSIATFIHNNTDMVVLTVFTTLDTVSVYSIYALVVGHLKQIMQAFSSGITPTMGQQYAKEDKEELMKTFEFYEYMTFMITTFLFTVGGLLLTPFVLLYTSSITDANYDQPIFGIILLIAEAVFCLKEPYVNLSYVANKFKVIRKHAFIEAGINIIVSLLLVRPLGLIGIAVGTLAGMSYRTIYHVVYAGKDLICRPVRFFFGKVIVFGLASLVCCLICCFIAPINDLSVGNWLICAIEYSAVMLVILLIVSAVFYRNDLGMISGVFKRFKKKL